MPFTAALASLRASYWKLRGWRIITAYPEYRQRLDTCYACKHFIVESEQCGLCGCFVSAKAMLTSEACPKGFWLRIREKAVTTKG